MTPHESRLWSVLRNRAFHGLKFRRQQPIDGYIADFCCMEKRLIVELDGSGHAEAEQKDYDQERNFYLESQGFQTLRFWNDEIENNLQKVIKKIESFVYPSPPAGEGSGIKLRQFKGEGPYGQKRKAVKTVPIAKDPQKLGTK